MRPRPAPLLMLAAGATAVLAVSSCSATVDNNAPAAVPGAQAVKIDDGGCAKNHDEIARLQKELAGNLYGIASDNSGKQANTNPNPVAANKKISITFSIEGLSHPFLVKQKQLAEAEGARRGAQVRVVSANDDVNQQFNDIQTSITQGADALMMMPAKTQGLDAVLNQATAQKVPYFFTQKGMLGVQPASQVLGPYATEGKQLGQWVVKHYAGRPNVNVVVVSGITGDASSVARVDAFKIELLRACTFSFLAEQPGQYRREDSNTAAQNMLAANKKVDLLLGANDEAALGGLSAIESAGRSGIDVVGMDGETDMFTAIKQGKALATVIHKPTAAIVVDEVVDYLRGKPVPQYKVLPEDVVTKQVVDSGAVQPAF